MRVLSSTNFEAVQRGTYVQFWGIGPYVMTIMQQVAGDCNSPLENIQRDYSYLMEGSNMRMDFS